MVYTIDEIKNIVFPIAQKHKLRAVYLFGSYARGTATESSDIDLLIDTTGSDIKGLIQLSAVYCDFDEAFEKSVDLVTISALEQPIQMSYEEEFRAAVMNERVSVYVAA